jgi:LysM repeat protein
MQYKIKKGDTLSSISRKLGISIKDLAKTNKIKDINKIQAGASLTIPQPKKKKSSSVEKVIPQAKKEIKSKQKSKVKKKKEFILPINVRQFFNPNQDRTEEDLSSVELAALKQVIANSQTPERIAEKKAQGIDPNIIEYKDYATTSEGSQYTDVDSTNNMSALDLASKMQNPNYNLKTFLGQATAIPKEGGGYRVVDTFDFKPKTQATGLKKLSQYVGSIDDVGLNAYGQFRNFMGYYGPQEGTGKGGKSNINLSAQGGQTRYNFNQGGQMDIKQQTHGIPKYPYGHPSEAVENLHDRRRDINDIIEEGYYIDREQKDVIYLDDNPKAFNSLLNELKLIDKELQMTQGMGGNTRKMNEANQTMGNVIKDLRGYAQGGNMDIKQQTQNVANQGRYGDSMLLHVNPAEVKGLAQAMPITVNPQTGQPEAFLPFLAPVLGGMAGSALLTGSTLGGLAASGISSALASGIGAGLATYAQTGGSGSKALMSALTGYGGAKAAELAGGLGASDAAITEATTKLKPELTANLMDTSAAGFNPANVTAGIQTPPGLPPVGPELSNIGQAELRKQMLGYQPSIDQYGKNVADAFSKTGGASGGKPTMFESLGKAFEGGYGEGFGNLAQGASSFGAYAPMAVGMGGRAVMDSQDLYEQQMRQMEMDEEQRKRDMYANNPEVQLYTAAGGLTQFADGGFLSSAKNLGNKISDDQYGYESNKQVYAPAKQQYAVNPDFMAGFAPETMYFRPDTLNAPSMSTRGGSAPTLGPDTYTGTKGGYDYEGSYDADGNFVAGTAQGVQFAPQTAIDPYAVYSGSAPQGLVQSAYNPYPVQPMNMSPIDDTEDTSDYGGIGGEDFYAGNPDFDFSFYNATDSAGNPLTSSPYGAYDQQAVQDIRDQYSDYFFDYDDIQDFYRDEMSDIGRQAGGDTDKKMPNKGLEALNKVAPDVVNKMGYQEGGQTDPLIQEVTMFILGESDNQQVVNQFVDKYGVEAFTQLREQILQSLVPNAQTSGLIKGVGNGGMDDDIMGTIGNKEKIAVSQDEFIVPADVVSMLGDGSSDAGSKELYDMMDRVRQKKTGTTKQAPKLANAGGLLPA